MRSGISSIYGFIVIFLLMMAAVQTWSSAVGSMAELQGASAESHQIQQMQGLEHLSLSIQQGNLTITNDGQIPSTVEYLRLVGQNDSTTITLDLQLAVGGSAQERVGATGTVEAVTALGNVFLLIPSRGANTTSGFALEPTGAANANAELFQNPYDPSTFYLCSGAVVYAFSADGAQLWSFDAGDGSVTDVMPLAGGDVYVSVGYQYGSNAAELYELTSTGSLVTSFPVRLDQSLVGPYSLTEPVSKGEDSEYALYDGWFYGPGGQVDAVSSDSFPLATSDPSDFYFYQTFGDSSSGGSCGGDGDEVKLYSYSDSFLFEVPTWTDYFYTGVCDEYPPQLLGATSGGGLVVVLFSQDTYAAADQTDYPEQDSYIIAVSTQFDVTYYAGMLPTSGYSGSMATDGTNIYLALPQSQEIQAVSPFTSRPTDYNVGFPASQLIWADDSLFALSDSQLKVYGPGMVLQKSVSFAPLTLSSFSNAFPDETALHTPSFLVLNSTSYAVLLENSTGYNSLVIGKYA